jgi:hypothetical protein
MEIFESGKMIEKYWLELENKFDNIKLHNFVVMPNHFYGILEITKTNKNCDCKICRGAPCGYPDNKITGYSNNKTNRNFDNRINEYPDNRINGNNQNIANNQGTHKGCPYNKTIL